MPQKTTPQAVFASNDEVENVCVVVRVRPMDKTEALNGSINVVSVDKINRAITVINPSASLNEPPKSYYFDNVFDGNSNQLDLYVNTARPIVDKVLEGYNGTILAYGQTGTGKTYTMIGSADSPQTKGVIPNAFAHIFGHIAKARENQKFLVRVSYMEIYNEEVRDLLGKDVGRSLEVKERPDIGVFVKDLSGFVVHNADDLENIMSLGNKNRAVGATKMNEESSRSHAIFSITIESSEMSGEDVQTVRMGKLQLVDLAGSERQSKTQASGMRLKEATKINLSLSVLGNVISALVDGTSTHIPYRNSKLTRLLQDSLGGNSKTVMCATIGPADCNYVETISTLRYASRAKNIQNRMHVNEEPKDALLYNLQLEITRLRQQLERRQLEEQLRSDDDEDDNDESDDGMATADQIEIECTTPEATKQKKRRSEAERAALAQRKQEHQRDIEHAKSEQEQLKNKLTSLEAKILVGGENLLEKAQTQEQLLEQSITELEEREKTEQALRETLQQKATERIDIEERYSTLQEASTGITKKMHRVMQLLLGAKSELADQQQEHQREKESIYENIRSLSRELALCELVVNSYIPTEYQTMINQHTRWNEDIGEWQLNCIAYTGNNMRKQVISEQQSSGNGSGDSVDISHVYLSYNSSNDNPAGTARSKSARPRTSGVPRPTTARRY